MKKFETPSLDVEEWDVDDIITSSPTLGEDELPTDRG